MKTINIFLCATDLDNSDYSSTIPEMFPIDEACNGEGLIPEYSHNTHLQHTCSMELGGMFILGRRADIQSACMPVKSCDYIEGDVDGLEIYKRTCWRNKNTEWIFIVLLL